jgi:MFS family permease
MMAGYTAYNLRTVLILTLGSLTFGYSYSVISGTLGQPGFLEYFNLENDASHTQAITGTINGLLCAGAAFGSLCVGWMCEARGRKKTLYLTCFVNIFGAALQAGSINLGMFIAARFIGGWGIGMSVVLIPLYQAEICKFSINLFVASTNMSGKQHHQVPVASSSASMALWLSSDMPLQAGSA